MERHILIIGDGALADAAARELDARFVIRRAGSSDRAALRLALEGCYGVFAATADPKLIAIVAAAEVDHFVVASSDVAIEAYARCLGVPATFIRQAENGQKVAAVFEQPEEFIGRTI